MILTLSRLAGRRGKGHDPSAALPAGGPGHEGDASENVDEWPSAEDFQWFFHDSPEIQRMMGSVGVTAEPSITFARLLETGDEVG